MDLHSPTRVDKCCNRIFPVSMATLPERRKRFYCNVREFEEQDSERGNFKIGVLGLNEMSFW